MKKLIFLTADFPFTEDSGAKVRDFSLIRLLQEKFRVKVLCGGGPRTEDTPVPTEFVAARRAPLFQRLIYPFRAYVRNGYNPKITEALALHFEPGATLWISRLAFAQYIPHGRRLGYRVILDDHNVESDLYLALCRAKRAGPLEYWRALQLRVWEKRYARLADHVAVTSESDRDLLARLSGRNAWTIPNFINIDRFSCLPTETRPEILFLGTLDYEPNRQGLEWFVDSIYPRCREFLRKRDWRVVVVGARAPLSLRSALGKAGISLAENVPDTAPYLSRASIVMVPLLSGGGTRLKILEAFAAGRAVVSTRKGAEGISGLIDRKNIFFAESAEEFSSAFQELVTNNDLRRSLGQNARALAQAQFDWRAGRPQLEKFIASWR